MTPTASRSGLMKMGKGWVTALLPRGTLAVCRFAVISLLFLTMLQQLIFMTAEEMEPFYPGPRDERQNGASAKNKAILRTTFIETNEPLLIVREEELKPLGLEGRRLLIPGRGTKVMPATEHEETDNKGTRGPFARIKADAEYDKRLGSSSAGQLANKLRDLVTQAKSIMVIAKEYEDFLMAEELRTEIEAGRQLLDQPKGAVILPLEVKERVDALSKLVETANKRPYDSQALIEKLKSKLESAEKQTQLVNMQSKLFSQMAAKAVPKGLHCLAMRLMLEWNVKRKDLDQKLLNSSSPELRDNRLFHYALFSDNVLAVAVVVNSTAQNALHPEKHVFHIVTDKMNYGAVKAWFALNPMRGMLIDIRSLEDFPWINASYVPVLNQTREVSMREFYFKQQLTTEETGTVDPSYKNFKFRNPKYLSILNHIRFYLPQIFPDLERILFLDDDVVVQRDLSDLWKVPMNGRVNLAVETCGEVFHRFSTYLNFSNSIISDRFDPQACGWAFGMNLFDLKAWSAGNFTEIYHFWQKANLNRTLWKLGTLPPALLTFYGHTEPLGKSWHVLGLGCNANVSMEAIHNAKVIHYNGHAKPWLELAMLQYQPFWSKYVAYSHEFYRQCSITPP